MPDRTAASPNTAAGAGAADEASAADEALPEPEKPTGHEFDAFHRRLHQIRPTGLSAHTAQTAGMRRVEALSGTTVGTARLWMGQTHVAPATRSANHHHGLSETGIYVVTGHPAFVFLRDDEEIRLETSPGDYIYVPPWVPHREENPDPDAEAVVVIARTTQEAIVVNLPDLRWRGPAKTSNRGRSWHTY
ncbi:MULTISPECIES: cupin domain-containing protein [unclassified Pseudofrankia]|uniref:cupin domain-containing protein n=1 Tax=unclassified Pseudofrankia TaxID=2994372 RepID=UPI000A8212F2|nr:MULTISPECIES: cupin domain-containing protein [unclassified Pseudofrankia]MDT3441040.1 cupin domain-containing protein [Pseudofrankia sp. BMG5.37]